MAESVLDHAAAFGAEWFFAFLVAIGFGILAKQLLNEYQRNNERKAELEERNAARQAELELKREERKRDELNERAQRDRERSEMEGRIAAQMERSNNISEGLQAAMESLRASAAGAARRNQGIARALARHGKQGRSHLRPRRPHL